MANTELLERVLKHIEDHPEQWNQEQWICETGGCFAGNACLLSGGLRSYNSNGRILGIEILVDNDDGDEVVRHVRDQAVKVLDLSLVQADILFSAYNTLSDLKRIVAHIKGEHQPFTATMSLDSSWEELGGTQVDWDDDNVTIVFADEESYKEAVVFNGAEPVEVEVNA